jgi:hypothetical protein
VDEVRRQSLAAQVECQMKQSYDTGHNRGRDERSVETIAQANKIVEEYQRQGLKLTLRQLYYQFVARNLFPNTKDNYSYLSRTMVYARDSGRVYWDAMEDRTRELLTTPAWSSPQDFLTSAVPQYAEDPWAGQSHRPEVFVEKDAQIGIVAAACEARRVPCMSMRGNCGQLPMRDAGLRFAERLRLGQVPVVFYLGDHDPSGIGMTGDVENRLELYAGQPIQVKRIALTIAQVRRYRLPPNVAKELDPSRSKYVEEFGTDKCWELDALAPNVVTNLIHTEVDRLIDPKKWAAAERKERKSRRLLGAWVSELKR